MYTEQTVNIVCSQNTQLMLYVQTKHSECMCTQQTVNAVCASSRQLILYVHTAHS
jgi:hypothetical protein